MTNTEKLFEILNMTSEKIQKAENLTYLEALSASGENWFQGAILQQTLSEEEQKALADEYMKADLDQVKPEEIRKAFQLAVLRGMKEATQPNHEMTPDAVALFLSYLVNKVTGSQKDFSILDPAAGSGNLLSAVINGADKRVSGSNAVDADDLLLKLAYVSANLQEHHTEFFHQDSLQPLLVDPVDVVICDLPVGYYPDEETASRYALKAKEGRSFVHHLLIEQAINHTKDAGYLLFLIPNGLFESDQADDLKKFLQKQAAIQGILQLPLSMFKQERHAKSIFILQKNGNGVRPPSQALLASLPSFSNQQAMQNIVTQIDDWFQKEK